MDNNNNTHKVHLLLYIWDRQNLDQSNNWAVAYKTIEMPFIPFIGLEIDFPFERNQKSNLLNGAWRAIHFPALCKMNSRAAV